MKGFTILELIIVVTLIAALAAISMPRLEKTYDAVDFYMQKENVADQINRLPYLAYSHGKTFKLYEVSTQYVKKESLDFFISLPEGWLFVNPPEVIYLSNGYCLGGNIAISNGSTTMQAELMEPHCKLNWL